jgi:hypothetical protein
MRTDEPIAVSGKTASPQDATVVWYYGQYNLVCISAFCGAHLGQFIESMKKP